MSRPFQLPDLGEGIHEGEILQVLVSQGDRVKEGDSILEVETDKAAVEIPSPFTGTVEEIRVKEGDTVEVGDVLMTFSDVEGEEEETEKGEKREKPEKEEVREAQDVEEEELIEEKGKKKEGPEEGKESLEESEEEGAERKEGGKGEPPGKREEGPVPASPATRRLAREMGVDLREVSPSGPGGRVTAEDVKSHAGKDEKEKPEKEGPPEREEKAPMGKAVKEKPSTLPDFSKWGEVERKPLRSIRRATAKQMSLAWSQIPHVSNQDWVDVTELERIRQKHKQEVEERGGRLTLTVFALKAAATALKQHPRFNASLDLESGEMVLKRYFHIGVAVATEEGLVVPVVRDVDRKSIVEISVELKDLVERAHERKVSLAEMQGGTFSITNVGPLGGGHFAPIINYPEVAILGMGTARMRPVAKEDPQGGHQVAVRLMMPLVLCIDHRILDGADALKFMRIVIDALEDPEEMLMTMT
jgi:pyruvate dehydrogenase E2 component (dihydrolipoamide acetyltransferase)